MLAPSAASKATFSSVRMARYWQVVTTAADRETALRLAERAVNARLAACAQVLGPVASVYWWQGQLDRAEEWQCLLKTREDVYPRLEALLRAEHPYQVPEILALPVEAGSADYLAWLDGELEAG